MTMQDNDQTWLVAEVVWTQIQRRLLGETPPPDLWSARLLEWQQGARNPPDPFVQIGIAAAREIQVLGVAIAASIPPEQMPSPAKPAYSTEETV